MIDARSVRKRFGRCVALDGVTLRIERGQAVALWGSNGAGKTTLIRAVLGLIPFRGTIEVGGIGVKRHGKAARRLMGYVPQDTSLPHDLRVGEAMVFFAGLRGVDRRSIESALARVDLLGARAKRVRQLSGGMRQRLALAIATLGDPPVLLLDEPTSNLDSTGRGAFLDLLLAQKRAGKTILFTSHRPEEVRDIADSVVTMESGAIVGGSAVERNGSVESTAAGSPEARGTSPPMERARGRAGAFVPDLSGLVPGSLLP